MSNQPPFIGSEYHGIVAGETGAGKTVVCNAIHTNIVDRISFFFNTQWKGYIAGETIEYAGEQDNQKIAAALARGATKFDIRPHSVDPEEEHEALTDALFQLAREGIKLACFNDEVHEYGATKGSSVHRLHKRGRDPGEGPGGIKTVSISQRYVSHEKSTRSEAMYFIQVGRPATQDRDALEEEREYQFDTVAERHSKEQFIMRDDSGETVSRAFSVDKNGELVYGPEVAHERYAE